MRILVFLVFLSCAFSFADTEKIESSKEDIETLLLAYKKESRRIEISLSKLTQALHRERNRVVPMEHFLGVSSERPLKRREIILKDSIQTHLKDKLAIDDTLEELQSQLRFLELRTSLSKKSKKSAPQKSQNTICTQSPLPNRQELKILREFGKQTDKETGLSWQHPGWLIQAGAGEVRSCSPGSVAYVGQISGKGHVLIVQSAKDTLVTYAHLEEIPNHLSKVGARIRAGERLGITNNKLYIEARQNGTALNPQKLLGAKLSIAR